MKGMFKKPSVRLTGVSTPFVGATWEYIKNEEEETNEEYQIVPRNKIKVFISSKCGDHGIYDKTRTKLKSTIEATNLAVVYMFEFESPSSLTAEQHYKWALESADLCIFIIDNNDGIPTGVQKEIDVASKFKKKSIYYFCDGVKKEKTPLEKSLMGPDKPKSITVHSFDEICQNGAKSVVDDIVLVYQSYCCGHLIPVNDEVELSTDGVKIIGANNNLFGIQKVTFSNLDRCKDYIAKLSAGYSVRDIFNKKLSTSEFDEWGLSFLKILFEHESIKGFNAGMFVDFLAVQQTEFHNRIVRVRWEAIQCFYLNELEKCLSKLNEALSVAEDNDVPSWIKQDILIDIRNIQTSIGAEKNQWLIKETQEKLDNNTEQFHYPVLDRINETLEQKYLEGLYKSRIEPPTTVSIGNNFDEFCRLIVNALVIAMYNGSLTHIRIMHDKLKKFMFYLSSKYDDWKYRRDLFKYAVFSGRDGEAKKILNSYPEILNNLKSDDAVQIMEYCWNMPIRFERVLIQIKAFGLIGDYLEEEDFNKYQDCIFTEVDNYFNNVNPPISIGISFFKEMRNIAYRLDQKKLLNICFNCFEKKMYSCYKEILALIQESISFKTPDLVTIDKLITFVESMIRDEKCRDTVRDAEGIVVLLRRIDRERTTSLDELVMKYFPDYYSSFYKIDVSVNKDEDFSEYISSALIRIRSNIDKQGAKGMFFGQGVKEFETIRRLLMDDDFNCDEMQLDDITCASVDTVMYSGEDISTKVDAVALLGFIILKYPQMQKKFKSKLMDLCDNADGYVVDNSFSMSNVDKEALRIAVLVLAFILKKDVYEEFFESISRIQGDAATTMKVTYMMQRSFEAKPLINVSKKFEMALMQNIFIWLKDSNIDIRWNALQLLMSLGNTPYYSDMVNNKVVQLVNEDCVYIKIAILRKLEESLIDMETKNYIISKCTTDSSYFVRKMACKMQSGVKG